MGLLSSCISVNSFNQSRHYNGILVFNSVNYIWRQAICSPQFDLVSKPALKARVAVQDSFGQHSTNAIDLSECFH